MDAPFFIADASAWSGDNPNWNAIAEMPHSVGIIIKATQGVSYAPSWFTKHWPAIKYVAGHERYGETWFRGCYHFLDFDVDGRAQADFYLAAVERAGGWDRGDILPIVDVERGSAGHANYDDTASEVIRQTTAFADRIYEATGRRPLLYGRGAMRDLGIASRMGCAGVWNPSWTATPAMDGLTPTWSVDDVVLWQYAGDGKGSTTHGWPLTVPGFSGNVDMSVYVDGSRPTSISSLKRRLLGQETFLTTITSGAGALVTGLALAAALWFGARWWSTRHPTA